MRANQILLAQACLASISAAATELWSTNSVKVVTNSSTSWPWQSYVTVPHLTPAYLEINATGEAVEPGLLFYNPAGGVTNGFIPRLGPIISRDTDLFGKQVISYWSGTGNAAAGKVAGHGYGQVIILNSTYDAIYTICPNLNITKEPGVESKCDADVHESFITNDDTILVTAYNITTADLSSVGGPKNGSIYDGLVFEIDIKTNKILFQWSALQHVPLNASKQALGSSGRNASNAWDFFHVNSIFQWEGGYIVNSRHTWTTYYLDRTGAIVWQINGADGGDFGTLPAGGHFSWEHQAQVTRYNSTEIHIRWFANNNQIAGQKNVSTGVELALTVPPNKANPPRLIANVSASSAPIYSNAEGSIQLFANGDRLLGYGIQPYFHYFSSRSTSGADLRWSARFNYDNVASSYRVFKQDWHAVPSTQPILVVKQQNTSVTTNPPNGTHLYLAGNLRGYVSWNGATDVKYYNLYAGSGNSSLGLVGLVPKKGFETEFYIPSAGYKSFQIGALYNDTINNGTGWLERKSAVFNL